MRIKTIISAETGFYISEHGWNDAPYAFDHDKHDWRYIGGHGWFVTEENKRIYEALNTQFDLEGWRAYCTESMSVDVEITS